MSSKPPAAERDFSKSFLWRVMLRPGRAHSWKQHARRGTLVYEVLGLLDKWASNDEQRFVPAGLEAILKHCNKGPRAEDKHYDERHLKFVMAELRARHIVSPYFTTHDGRYGFVMEPHELRSTVVGNVCVKHAPKRFECSPEDEERFKKLAQSSPAVHRAVPRLFTAEFTGCSPDCSPRGEKKFTGLFTPEFTAELEKVYEDAELTEALLAKWFADDEQTGAPIRCNRLSVEPENRRTRLSVNDDEQQQEQKQRQEPESVSFSSSTTETAKPKDKTSKRLRKVLSPEEYEAQKLKRAADKDEQHRRDTEADIAAERKARGYEPCSDGIWRPLADREKHGFTVRTGTVWSKP